MTASTSLDIEALRPVLDADPDRVYVLDAAGRYAFFNAAVRAVTPAAALGRLLGRAPGAGLPADLARPLDAVVRRALGGETTRERRQMRPLSGALHSFDTTATPIRNGAGVVTGVLLRARDVTGEVRAEERLRREVELQGSVAELARAAASGVPTQEILQRAADAARSLVGGAAAAVARRAGTRLVFVGVAGEGLSTAPGSRYPLEEAPAAAAAIRERRPVLLRLPEELRVRPDLPVSVCAPIRSSGRIWGALIAWPYGEEEIDEALPSTLAQLADVVSLALDAASSRRRLGALAQTDPLTGLFNARAMREGLVTEIAKVRRYGGRLVLAQIDLDRFKLINDVHGHAVGDVVLRGVGAALRENARTGDLVGRMGGEEFVWLMLETDTASAVQAAERLRRRIAATTPPGGAPVTASVGIAALGEDDDARSLLAAADLAVYQAKADGRDLTRVCAVVGGRIDAASRAVLVEHDRIVEGLRALARRRAGDPMRPSQWAGEAARIAREEGWEERDVRRLFDAAALLGVEPELASAVLAAEQVSWLRGEGAGGRILSVARGAAAA